MIEDGKTSPTLTLFFFFFHMAFRILFSPFNIPFFPFQFLPFNFPKKGVGQTLIRGHSNPGEARVWVAAKERLTDTFFRKIDIQHALCQYWNKIRKITGCLIMGSIMGWWKWTGG